MDARRLRGGLGYGSSGSGIVRTAKDSRMHEPWCCGAVDGGMAGMRVLKS